MSTIDERVVEMKFNNSQFEQGVKTTLASLENLNKGLKLEGATKGLEDVGAAAKGISLSGIASGVETLVSKFQSLHIVGLTALVTIANQAVISGQQILKSLTIDPLAAGLHEYETNLNSIQTILSNTQWQNASLADVNKALNELNIYSDKTIYNFGEMARNIGTFTAAGVGLETSVNAIKGIANLAAISGSSSDQASTAMYQLSQALATGTVKLMDWNSVVNAGMGGKVFQDALMETARVHGVAVDKIVKEEGSFRDSLQKGWLTSQILTETLSKFTGDLTASQLKAMGYNDQQIAGILKMGQTAQDAATKIKTASQLINTLQESAGSGWAQTWQLIFGDFEEAKTLFSNVYNVLGGFITASANARNKVIGDWKELGGRTVIIQAISNAFYALIAVLKPIKDAFREIFPATTGKQLYDLSVTLRNFTQNLKIGSDTADKLKRTFAGVFAVLGIGWDIVKSVAKTFAELFGVATKGSGSFLEITAKIGDFLVAVREAIHRGDGLAKVFETIGKVLSVPLKLIGKLGGYLASLFDGFDPTAAANMFVGLAGKILSSLDDILKKAWSFAPSIGKAFGNFGEWIANAFKDINYGDVLSSINTGLFAGLLVIFKQLFSKFKGTGDLTGIVDTIKDAFGGLTDTLSSMQNTLRAATLLQIAAAVGILTISVAALSKIDSEGLTRALTAITIMFTQLMGSMAVIEKMGGASSFAKMGLAAGAMILLSISIDLLAIAVKKIADLSWEELAKGLTGVAVLLGALGLFTTFADTDKGGLLKGAGIILLALGIKILASALADLGKLSWGEIGKGLTAMAGGLALIGAALFAIPPSSLFSAAAVLIVATSLGMIGDSIKSMGDMKWGEIGKGLTAMAGGLTLIVLALGILPPSSLLSAAAILIVASSLSMIGDALGKMGGMSWEEIGKGVGTLAVTLGIIAGAMALMTGALPGAAALLIVAASLAVIAPILITFSNMSLEEIGKGLLMLAGVFAVLGVAGLLLTPLVPTLLGLGIAITLLGVGMLMAGAGVLLFATGLTALSVAGAAGAAAMIAIVSGLIGLIPLVMQQIGLGIIAFAEVIANAGPAITKAITVVLLALITAIATLTPKIVETLAKLLVLLLNTLADAVPKMVDAGLRMLTGILRGIANNIGKVVSAATDVIVNFINGISNSLSRIIQAGVNLIISFVEGMAQAIRNNSDRMGRAGGDLASAIVEGMVRGIASGAGRIASAARNAAAAALEAAKEFLGINSPSKAFYEVGMGTDEGFALGIDRFSGLVSQSAEGVGKEALTSLSKTMTGLSDIINSADVVNPTITPVLDLSGVKKNASLVNGLFGVNPIAVNSTYSSARNASDGYNANQVAVLESNIPVDSRGVTFIQNNNSPKALTPAEIYRQTKNQLSTAKVKGAL